MKSLVTTFLFVTCLFFTNQILAQDSFKTENVEKTFAIEVNAETSLNDLKAIEKMLLDDYNITINFENVKIENDKIVALRMQMINGSQSFMKSINNFNAPIKSFKIKVTTKLDGKYYASLDDSLTRSSFSIGSDDLFSSFNSFSDDFSSFRSNFFNFNEQIDEMYKQIEESQKRFKSFFDELQNNATDKQNSDLKIEKPKTTNTVSI